MRRHEGPTETGLHEGMPARASVNVTVFNHLHSVGSASMLLNMLQRADRNLQSHPSMTHQPAAALIIIRRVLLGQTVLCSTRCAGSSVPLASVPFARTMADVKDILGVPRGVAPALQQDAPKTKERMQRPAGMSREAFALLDGSHPIPPSHLAGDLNKKAALSGLKQKRKLSSKGLSTYQLRPFSNPARKDSLTLQHWVKCFKDAAGKLREADEVYPFAKFNKQV